MEQNPLRNQRAKDEKGLGLHNEGLYDEGQDLAGEKVNLATGESFEREDARETAPEAQVTAVEPDGEDALPTLQDETPGDAWLRKNDPNFGK